MGLFDVFTKEQNHSWSDENVIKWIETAKNILKSYYLSFKGSQFDEYTKDDNLKLLAKICYAMFGPPTVELSNSNELVDGYQEEQKSFAKKILNKILEAHSRVFYKDLLVGIIFVVCKENEKEYSVPIFSLFANGNPEIATAERWYIDTQCRIYKSWSDWETNNLMPMLKYAYPKNGFFSCADSLSYEFDETKEPVVKFGSSPQCNKMSRIFRGTDTLSMVTALGCGAVAIGSFFTPIGPAVLFGSALTGGTFGVYGAGRAGYRLYDKGTHGEKVLRDLESATLWLSIAATPLHFGTTFFNSRLVNGAVVNGRIFSDAERILVTTLNFTTLGADFALLSFGFVNLYEKANNKQLTTLDVLQFSMSVFFFSNTLIRPQTASAIIENAQKNHIQNYASSITDAEAKATFDKFVAENSGDGGIKQRSKIVRTINRIENPDALFSNLKNSESILIGGRKGRSLLVNEGTSVQRIPVKTTVTYTETDQLNLTKNFQKVLNTKLKTDLKTFDMNEQEISIDVEDYKINGESIFKNISLSIKARICQVFDNADPAIIKAAFDLVINFKDIEVNSTIEKIVSLIEIIKSELLKKDSNANSKVDLNAALKIVKSSEFIADIKTDIKTVKQIAKTTNICFTDALKAVYHFRKHGHEFINKIPGSSSNPIVVYLKDAQNHIISNNNLAEIQTLESGVEKLFYVTSNDEFAVTLNNKGHETICTMFCKNGVYQDYLKKGLQVKEMPVSHTVNLGNSNFAQTIDQLPQIVADMTGIIGMQNLNIFVQNDDGQRYPY